MSNNKKVALITGGTSGIGYETAKVFLQKDYQVVVAGIDDHKKVDAALVELSQIGEIDYHYLDVSDEQGCKGIVEFTTRRFGQIDCLLNIAGIVGNLSPLVEIDLADVRKTLDVNLMGTVYMSYYAAKEMIRRKKGVIVNMSSISGSMVTNTGVGYHSSKAGINMATKAMARELAQYGIRCVAIAPGSVNTGMQDADVAEEAAAMMLKNRLIEPEEIANIAYMLCCEEASAINGTVVMADDGFTAWKSIF